MLKTYSNIDFDSPEMGKEAVERMLDKKCLYDVYKDTYEKIMKYKGKYLNSGEKVLEIGSGGGFMKKLYPDIITSDVREIEGIDMVLNAMDMPFEENSLDAIVATHVLHHIPDVEKFFKECERVIKPGGGMIFVEPYWGILARLLYKNVHPEPFNEKAVSWQFETTGPMSGSNQALAYMLLKRDREKFEEKFPSFEILGGQAFNCVRYMATGGIWLKPKLPGFMFPLLKGLEWVAAPIMPLIGIHYIFAIKIL